MRRNMPKVVNKSVKQNRRHGLALALAALLAAIAPDALAAAQSAGAYTIPGAEQLALSNMAKGETRLISVGHAGTSFPGVYCIFYPRKYWKLDDVLKPSMVPQPRPKYYHDYRKAEEAFVVRYNVAVVSHPEFAHTDVCAASADGAAVQPLTLSATPRRDDGSVVSAIRFGRVDWLMERLAAEPRSARLIDSEFGHPPIEWAIAKGRTDIIQALFDNGVDISLQSDAETVLQSAMRWKNRPLAEQAVAHFSEWKRYWTLDFALWEMPEFLGQEFVRKLYDRHMAGGAEALDGLPLLRRPQEGILPPRQQAEYQRFYRYMLAHPGWKSLCQDAAGRRICDAAFNRVSIQAPPSDITFFTTRSYVPSAALVSMAIAEAARRRDVARLKALAALPFDRDVLLRESLSNRPVQYITVQSQPWGEPEPIAPAEQAKRDRKAKEFNEWKAARLAATRKVLKELGVPHELLPNEGE